MPCQLLGLLVCIAIAAAAPPVPSPGQSRELQAATILQLEFLGLTTAALVCDCRGEGFRIPMDSGGGDVYRSHTKFPRKRHGVGQVGSHGTMKPSSKRSFCRALKRADTMGWTFYRGRFLMGQSSSAKPPATHPPPLMVTRRRSPRASVLCWNVGGLTTPLYHEVIHWMQKQQLDICMLQSIRWTEDRVWVSHGFSFIQCGDPTGGVHGHAGLLTIISQRFCSFDQISYACLIPGRMLHVHCKLGEIGLDLLNCYQHPMNKMPLRPDPLASRASFWTMLDRVLIRIPYRNLVLLGGDYNCVLPGGSDRSHANYPDSLEFQELMRKHSMASVRTHDAKPSYQGPMGKANIDYIFMRREQLDGEARRGFCDASFPLASWRQAPDHLPIVMSFPKNWRCWYHANAQSNHAKAMKAPVARPILQESPAWTELLDQAPQFISDMELKPQAIHSLVAWTGDFCAKHFDRAPQKPSPIQTTRPTIQAMWALKAELRQIQTPNMAALFRAWTLMIHVKKLKQKLDQDCRQLRLSRVEHAVQQAENAATMNNARMLFATVRQLCPKQRPSPIRLRSPQGHPLNGQEECDFLQQHFSEVYASEASELQLPSFVLTEMPFSLDELQHAFDHASTFKAAGPEALPNLYLRAFAPALASWTFCMLQQLWLFRPFEVPQLWKDAWLTLLAKRQVRTPADVRPIALTDSIGKLVLGILTKKLKIEIHHQLIPLPLFAYMPRRSTIDALLFVFDHCRLIRATCQAASNSYWKTRQSVARPPLCGGLMLSLDMSQAFDRLPRSELLAGFNLIAPSSHLAWMLMHWLTEVRYHFQHRGYKATVNTSRGVRQGCKASPLEWTVFLCTLCHKLDLALPRSLGKWTLQHLITYADDLISKWVIKSVADFHTSLQELSIVLQVLENVGMTVNFKKTVILMRLEGSQRSSIFKKHTIKQNGQHFLCVPHKGALIYLPIVHEHVYLGTKICYHNFEDRTLAHRLHISRVTFLRLRTLLTGHRALPLALRVRIWQACIRSSCLYGLEASGLTPGGCQRLHRRFAKDLRQLARSPSHLTRETTSEVCARLQVPEPLPHLVHTLHQRLATHDSAAAGLDQRDFLVRFDFQAHYSSQIALVQAAMSRPATTEEFECPYCQFVAPNKASLTRHLRTTHCITIDTPTFSMLRDAWQGTPCCTHCKLEFASLRNLKKHIHKSSCHFFDPNLPHQEPLADSAILRKMVTEDSWAPIWGHTELLERLRHECVLCQAWQSSNKTMSEHLHRAHHSTWHRTQVLSQTLVKHLPKGDCQACGQKGARAHVCPVMRQLVIIRHLTEMDVTAINYVASIDEHEELAPTDRPQLSTPTKRTKTLYVGLMTQGRDSRAFQPARDAFEGQPQCAHCYSVHANIHALSRHIENDSCPCFDANKHTGAHVPCTWPWLLELAQTPETLLQREDAKQILSTFCVLCGRHMRRASALVPHLLADHEQQITRILETYGSHFADLVPKDSACVCGLQTAYEGHRCHMLYQMFALHHVAQSALPDQPEPSDHASWFQLQWQTMDLASPWTHTCTVCSCPCDQSKLLDHLQAHEEMQLVTVELLALAASPKPTCCHFCASQQQPSKQCPVSVNLCLALVKHGPDSLYHMTEDDFMGQLDDTVNGLLALNQSQQNKRRRGDGPSPPSQRRQVDPQGLTKALIQIALRHESQLQALAQTDQFVIFLQGGEKGAMPLLMKEAAAWKDMAQKQQTKGPLRQHLLHRMMQEALQRFDSLMKSNQEDEVWQGALRSQMINSDGSWPFLQYDAKMKQLKKTSQDGIPMDQMSVILQELVELTLNPAHILRFKALRKVNDTAQTSNIYPWLIQVTLRENRLWEILVKLSLNSIWLTVLGRLRQHQPKATPLVQQLAHALPGRS